MQTHELPPVYMILYYPGGDEAQQERFRLWLSFGKAGCRTGGESEDKL